MFKKTCWDLDLNLGGILCKMFYLIILIVHESHDQIAPMNNSNWEYRTWALCKLHVTYITFAYYGGVESSTKDCTICGEQEW